MLFDEKELKTHFDGDEELIGELIEVFESSYPLCLENLKKALSEANHKDIELHAHTLKGMIANFFSEKLKVEALELEKMGREGKLDSPEKHIKILESELPTLITELKEML